MKVLALVLTVFLLATVAAAQAQSSPTDAPGVAVVKKKWQKRERPRILLDDLSSNHEKNIEYERSVKETLHENTVSTRARTVIIPPYLTSSFNGRDSHAGLSTLYKVDATITKTGMSRRAYMTRLESRNIHSTSKLTDCEVLVLAMRSVVVICNI